MPTAIANATAPQSRLVEILGNELIEEVLGRLNRRFLELGAAHLQIGKTYLYQEGRTPQPGGYLKRSEPLSTPKAWSIPALSV